MSTHTTLDTIEVTPNLVQSWKVPPFQRPLRVNDKVMQISSQIREDGGVIPGVIVLGVLNKDRYIVDGQHRREAFLLSECLTGYVDIRVLHFDDMAQMGEEYVNLNSRLVNMRPDDVLRGLEETFPTLGKIKKRCAFVGYDQIRRSEKSPVLSMSALLRCWSASSTEVPRSSCGSALSLARTLSMEEADTCIDFLSIAYAAWGRDQAYARLWGNLNLSLCMWLYRRLVITPYSGKTKKLTKDAFTKCLMSLSADSQYPDWLVGRNNSQRDMSPAYSRIKAAFAKRLEADTGKRPYLPQPAWAS
jgi:hypothetical protein